MFWHLLLRKLFNTKIFALKTFSKDPDSVACATIWKTSPRIGGRDAVKWLRNKSGKDFCPLAQSIISAWKTYGKEAIFFPSSSTSEKVGYAFFRDHKVFKVLLVIFKKFPRHLNRSAVIIIKLTMPSYFTSRVPFESKKEPYIIYNSKNGYLNIDFITSMCIYLYWFQENIIFIQ